MMKKGIWFSFLALSMSCSSPEKNAQSDSYFSLANYFKQEVARLTLKKPLVHKTVAINGSAEIKSTADIDWEKELHIFSESDINKASWRGLFKHIATDSVDTYTSSDEKIPVKSLQVKKIEGKPIAIAIVVERINSIYQSADTLHYFPDSLYSIVKSQKTTLMALEKYSITGRLK